MGIKVNDPENRKLEVHAEKICAGQCDTEDSYFIRDSNDAYFARCDYPVGISKVNEVGVKSIADNPNSYSSKHSKKVGNDYYYVFPGSNFEAACENLQTGDEEYENDIRQYILDNIVKM